ncbi:hypothetical protein JAAARDRAFT_82098 [Jaapia argillacea MUCL 33604]|uniref:Uncharacterized protein n=1 Tax=Jaapia argillacea MUCL 33604 TaxID=933084 RepID=A0A067PGY7_9AGAM|nr:hypothetical protein JAAARDRAFT_82098 [Jaapia argillacea MUCL 33604]
MVRFGCKPRLLPILLLGPPGYYIYTESQRLASTYPALPPHLTNTRTFHFLAVPNDQKSQYSAEVCSSHPISGGEGVVEREMGQAFLGFISHETPRSIIRPPHKFTTQPGDTGSLGFAPSQPLLHSTLKVTDPPSTLQPLTMIWQNPPSLIRFFEKVASWGYPFRLMSGGRHTLEVMMDDRSGGGGGEGEGEWVLSFGCAHDYERINPVDGKEDGKVVPEWVGWAHKTWARWLLDGVVKELMKRREFGFEGGRPLEPKAVSVADDHTGGGRKLDERRG